MYKRKNNFIGKRLRELRKDFGLTQLEFADKFGISKFALVNYEAGRRDPPAMLLSRVIEEMGVNAYWLHTGRANKYWVGGAYLKEKISISLQEIVEAAHKLKRK